MHKFIQSQQTVSSADARLFIILLHIVGLNALVPDDEGHGFVNMDAQFDRGGVVWQYGQTYGLIHLLDGFEDGLDKPLVQVVDSL